MRNLMSALGAIPCAKLSHNEWLAVGMALEYEGYSVTVWDDWSRTDPDRYHPGECERRWASFHNADNPVTGGTIIKLAQDHGWTPYNDDGVLGWNDIITDDGSDPERHETTDVEMLTQYIEALFGPDENVSIVVESQYADDRWRPIGNGVARPAEELLESLRNHPDSIAWTTGDWKPEAGAWIRFNPTDGKGGKAENVTRWDYTLVECDDIDPSAQIKAYKEHQLPIAALVESAGKSIHAIVHVDAPDLKEYRKRVDFLYKYLEDHGLKVDRNNKNANRLSRLPGAIRRGKMQRLLGVNIGRKSWADWLDFVDGESDSLPDIKAATQLDIEDPPLAEPLIEGILRRGHKMLISGASKAGKSFLLIELAAALTHGDDWLGFTCRKSKVLYINLEIAESSFLKRLRDVWRAKHYDVHSFDGLYVWNLRGRALPLDQLVPKLVRRIANQGFDAIIIDPIYKVITGDENNASEMGAFCNQFDRISEATGCAVIYCHHHSKGDQGQKKAQDRASGSGVFARDPDAQLDLIELVIPERLREKYADTAGSTPWRMESSLREFQNITPVNFWFNHPIHEVDTTGLLQQLGAPGSVKGNAQMANSQLVDEEQLDATKLAFDGCVGPDGYATIGDLCVQLDLSRNAIKARLDKFPEVFERDPCGRVRLLDRGGLRG